MDTRYEYTAYIFRQIDPMKKFMSFTCAELPSFEDFRFYIEIDTVLQVNGLYYQFFKKKDYTSVEPRKCYICVKKNNTVLTTIEY